MGWKGLLLALKDDWIQDDMSDVARSVTFAGVLALFPFLIFLVALGGLLIEPGTIQQLVEEVGEVAPAAVTDIVAARLSSLQEQSSAGLLTLSALAAFWAASGGIAALIRALNTAYDVKETRPLWKVRGIAILMTLFAAGVALLAALVAVVTPAVAGALGEPGGKLWLWLRLPIAALLTMFMWAVLYHFLPNVEQKFRLITPGSVIGVLLWVAASWGFSAYVANFGKYDAIYGALGGVVVLLLWMWISAQTLLLGAEINALLAQRPQPAEKELAERGVEVATGNASTPVRTRSHHARWRNRLWLAGAALVFLQLRRRQAR